MALDKLADRLAAADAGQASPPPPAPDPDQAGAGAPAPADESQLWIGAAEHYGAIVRAMLPDHVKLHWTDERLRAVGVELAGCAKHYGWKFGGVLNHPLAKLAVVSFPLAWPLIEPYAMPYLQRATGRVPDQVAPVPEPRPASSTPTPVQVPPIA